MGSTHPICKSFLPCSGHVGPFSSQNPWTILTLYTPLQTAVLQFTDVASRTDYTFKRKSSVMQVIHEWSLSHVTGDVSDLAAVSS